MRLFPALLLLSLPLTLSAFAADAPAPAEEAAIQAIGRLGRLNGEALACGHRDEAARLKQLALRHAPKTARYGSVLENATQEAFLERTRGSAACRAATEVALDTTDLARHLDTVLPSTAATPEVR